MLTVVTPTYNRAYTLSDCYQSLCSQTDHRFLWMIVDDGSTDQTEETVAQWMQEGKLRIQYLKKPNGGKASALNMAIDHLETPYAVCLDSDDTFFPKAVELALAQLQEADKDPGCCGVLALRSSEDGKPMGGKPIPEQYKTITAITLFLEIPLGSELTCFYKTDVLKQYRFPQFEGEKFISPAWMQYSVCEKYYFNTSRDSFCKCEYIADGLTKNKNKVILKNPRGYSCVKKMSFNYAKQLKKQIRHGLMYDCGVLISGDKDWLKGVKHKILAVLLMPGAMYIKHKRFSQDK